MAHATPALIRFTPDPDVDVAEPEPVVLDGDGIVLSGLEDMAGAQLLGFRPEGETEVTIERDVALDNPSGVIGLQAVFGFGGLHGSRYPVAQLMLMGGVIGTPPARVTPAPAETTEVDE